jgi:hypothetical protein
LSIGNKTTGHSTRANEASPELFVRSAQQREQAAARRRYQKVDDGDQQREQ